MHDAVPHIHVACAVIQRHGLILATQRSAVMALPLKWEFPGGKLEPGETAEECLIRELHEELGICVRIIEALESVTHRYADMLITLTPFRCDWPEGELTLHEHCAFRWLQPDELTTLDWATADWPIITRLVQGL